MADLSDPVVFKVLRARGPLALLPSVVVEDLVGAAESRTFAPGEALLRQGDPADGLLIPVEGSGYAQVTSLDGVHRIGRFAPGDIVGEMALVTRETRSADVIAETPVRALHVSTEAFDRIAGRHLELATMLTALVAERLGHSEMDSFGGKRVEQFRILQCIGRGGMSVVYRARDEVTGETVALKMMSYRLIYDRDALARFRREAEVVQRLQHANIARLHRFFQAYRTYFLEMELLDGDDLQRVIAARGRLPESDVRAILGQLAGALSVVHQQGIVHRDLKPANVMITGDGVVKLTDFGIAVGAFGPAADETRIVEYAPVGTPAYMAPEQLVGAPIDQRADIYALGCLAYELLTGGRLFTATHLLELVQAKMSLRVPPAAEIAGGISAEMHAFLGRALRFDAAERLASVEQLTAWARPVAR